MRYQNPFAIDGRWFRGNTHSHTTRSDGALSLEQRCAAYRQAGYDFLVITDHDVVGPAEPIDLDGLLAIPGAELHPPNPYGGETYHIVAINVRQPIDARQMHPNEVIEAVLAQGGLACLGHPYWSGHTLSDYAPLRGYFGIEVFNRTCERGIGKGLSETHWDDILDRVGPTVGIATDDCHKVSEDAYAGWIMVRAESLELESILRALADGCFYSTQGPEFRDIRVEKADTGPMIHVRCSPVKGVVFKGRTSSGSHVVGDNGQLITEASHTCKGPEKYIRIELVDLLGNKAWSNPFFLAEMEAA